uniref:protein O-GlcNAcase-like isoform X1 n=1 Tax=Ciona intestinalis TaxID=7719 RepID=UPI0002B8E825|nr:protein O-GlcNAcase-like isoform X1 [Ciona intestinalis]|eukprot:XP_018668583.1 protein O-GlcNAcase-like isoform X1 [Ciona intestinalis]
MSDSATNECDFPDNKDNIKDEMGQAKSKLKKVSKSKKNEPQTEDKTDEVGFMCGVVEGFYGRPWTAEQRKELFRRMEVMGLNTYLYAPKDDYKHRLFWREKYSDDEAALLQALIEEADTHNVLFVYAISPGLDMVFASPTEIAALKNKLLQVKSLGCKAFALLFDDIDPVLCASDLEEFQSSADAQASITNLMFETLQQPRFIFCPTEYCASMAIPDVSTSIYLKTLGSKLDPNISVMWTGPKVVSHVINVDSIKTLSKVLQRKVVIWDNIHANDYDPKRVFLGPFKGRSTHLIQHIAGVMTNPNCEFEANYVAMHTLATWWKSFKPERVEESAAVTSANESTSKPVTSSPTNQSKPLDDESISSGRASDSDSDTDSDYSSHDGRFFPSIQNFNHGDYDPDKALYEALIAWLPVFSLAKYPTCKVVPRSGTPPAMPMVPNLPIVSHSPIATVCTTKNVTKPVVSVVCKDDSSQDTSTSETPERGSESSLETQKSDMSTAPYVSVTIPSDKTNTDVLTVAEDHASHVDNAEGDKLTTNKADCDVQMEENDGKLEEMQTEGEGNKNKLDQMETEEVTVTEANVPMQTDDADSDVSMATANSSAATDVEEMQSSSPGGAEEKATKNDDSAEKVEKSSGSSDSKEREVTQQNELSKDNPLSVEDITMLAECFYLPYEHGVFGRQMVQRFRWLKDKAVKMSQWKNKKSEDYLDKALEWSEKAMIFEEQCRRVQGVFNKICMCPNRALLYDLFPYLWDLKGVVTMLRSYVKWLGHIEIKPGLMRDDDKSESTNQPTTLSKGLYQCTFPLGPTSTFGWVGPDPEPWVFRGGLSGEFQRLLPISSAFDLFCQTLPRSPQVSTYIVRPYVPTDEESVFSVCYSTWDDGKRDMEMFENHKQLPADRLTGALLTLSPEYCFVVEDESGICGYLAATLNAKDFWKKYELAYLPEMREKYAKPESEDEMNDAEKMIVDLHSTDDRYGYGSDSLAVTHPAMMTLALTQCAYPNVAKSMTVCLLSALKSHNSSGVHVIIDSNSKYFQDLYTKLGFTEITDSPSSATDGVTIYGRIF